MKKYFLISLLVIFFSSNYSTFGKTMEDLPYHHLPDGKFRNPKGSPSRDPNFKWNWKKWNEEKKKIKINIPADHVIEKNKVLADLKKYGSDDYVAWIGHATFLIKLGDTTIITDPVFSKNMGPLIFGPKRYIDPAIDLKEIPEINLLLLTHNHYDHLDYKTIKKFPFKESNVLTPLKLGKYFTKNKFKKVKEMDWYDQVIVNDLKITFVPAVHWSKRTLTDTDKTLWGSFLIEYKNKKIFFACDTGYGNIYKELGKKYGPIDLTFINIGAYNFYPIAPKKDKSIFHSNPEEALSIGKDLKSKKILGMHWGTVILSLEDPFEPPIRFKNATNMYGYHKDDAIIFKIGEVQKLENLL